MHIECVGCSARYDVPDEAVRPGRAMRCVRCGETWVPRADDAAPAPVSVHDATIEPVPDASRAPLAPVLVPPAGAALAGAWLTSVVVLAVAVWAAWHYRGWIGHVWPPARRLTG